MRKARRNIRVLTPVIMHGLVIDTDYFTMTRIAFPARIYCDGVYIYTQTLEVFYV